MVWADKELFDFAHSVAQIFPTSAVAVTPHAFRDHPQLVMHWEECLFVDSAMYGSVRNQVWRLYIWGQLDSAALHCDPIFRSTSLLADAYRAVGETPQKDDLGEIRIIPFDRVPALTVLVENAVGERYSASSHIPQLAMSEIWSGEPRWPRCAEQGEEEPFNREKIVILGCHPKWMQFGGVSNNAIAEALFLSGPVALMKRLLYGPVRGIQKRAYRIGAKKNPNHLNWNNPTVELAAL